MTDMATHLSRLADQMDLVAFLMIGQPPRAAWDCYGNQLQADAEHARKVADEIEREAPNE